MFEDILMRENIVNHYLPLRYGENNTWQEKGIDVWLAGDGDYVPLVRKLNTLGTRVMLICWEYSYYNENGALAETKTSRQLLDEVLYPVLMHERINKLSTETSNGLFVKEKKEPEGENIENTIPVKSSVPQADPSLVSIIFSIKNGFGFIKDEKINNVFFYYYSVTNRDFDELEVGIKVRYLCEEDTERTKRDGAPRYRAYKVTVID